MTDKMNDVDDAPRGWAVVVPGPEQGAPVQHSGPYPTRADAESVAQDVEGGSVRRASGRPRGQDPVSSWPRLGCHVPPYMRDQWRAEGGSEPILRGLVISWLRAEAEKRHA